MNIKEIKSWDELGNWHEHNWYRTPNGVEFCIHRVDNNIYGNPSYWLYFDGYELLDKIKAVKSANRIGRLYYTKGYLYFNSYNVGYDLNTLFDRSGIETGLERHHLERHHTKK